MLRGATLALRILYGRPDLNLPTNVFEIRGVSKGSKVIPVSPAKANP